MQPRLLALGGIATAAVLVGGGVAVRSMANDDASKASTSAAISSTSAAVVAAPATTFAPDAAVRFVQPLDGATVSGPVDFLVDSERVIPARFGQPKPNEGHFVVLIDRACLAPGQVTPVEEGVYNFGTGGSNFRIDAEPGAHEVCLQWVDNANVATTLTESIDIIVT